MVTQNLLNQYRREVESASNDARNYLTAMCEAYIEVNPNASVANMRKFAIQTLQDGLYMYGDEAKVIANDFFDRLAQEANSKATAEMFDNTDADIVEQKVRYYAKSLVEGDTSKFIKDVSDLTGFYVKREAFCNMAKNCGKAGIRYARVPSGRETCAFCFMLASRGFVYWGEKEAGADGHEYHPHCDCIIVPGFHKDTGISADAQIEGYEPTKLYERYQKCYDAINPNGTWDEVYEQWKNSDQQDTWEKFKTKALVKEINTRDWGWVWSGKNCIYDKEDGANPLKKESDVSKLLTKQGFNVTAIKEINKSNIKTPDVYIQGAKWEYKIPEGWSKSKEDNAEGEQTVRRAFWQAEKKANRLVVSNTANNTDYHELWQISKKVFETGNFNIDEVLIVGKNGELIRLKK